MGRSCGYVVDVFKSNGQLSHSFRQEMVCPWDITADRGAG